MRSATICPPAAPELVTEVLVRSSDAVGTE